MATDIVQELTQAAPEDPKAKRLTGVAILTAITEKLARVETEIEGLSVTLKDKWRDHDKDNEDHEVRLRFLETTLTAALATKTSSVNTWVFILGGIGYAITTALEVISLIAVFTHGAHSLL